MQGKPVPGHVSEREALEAFRRRSIATKTAEPRRSRPTLLRWEYLIPDFVYGQFSMQTCGKQDATIFMFKSLKVQTKPSGLGFNNLGCLQSTECRTDPLLSVVFPPMKPFILFTINKHKRSFFFWPQESPKGGEEECPSWSFNR